jgi:TFIIF-interacting CTD phosphatase-like protein
LVHDEVRNEGIGFLPISVSQRIRSNESELKIEFDKCLVTFDEGLAEFMTFARAVFKLEIFV